MEEKFQDIKIYFARQKEAKEACDKIVDAMEEKLKICNFFSVDQLRIVLQSMHMTMFSRYTKQETEKWGWTTVNISIKPDVEYDLWAVCMPPARKQNMIHLNPNPFKEMYINVPRGCGKTMTAMKMIEDICENTKLREEINSKIKKYWDTDFYGHHFVLEYQHQPCEKRYRVEYRIPFDSPCLLGFRPVEEAGKYFDEQENKARKELIDRVIKDINKGDVESMPFTSNLNEFVIQVPYGYAPYTIGSGSYTVVPAIEKIEIYNERVVKVTFKDGTFTKSICAENDIFDVDTGITICLLKKMLGKNGHKIYNNMIRDAHKLMNDQENRKIEKQMAKEEARKKQKEIEMKRMAKKMKAKEEAIDIQKQAYIRAMQEMGMTNDGR